ncbi:hypothetical protein [Sporisorium scitamineum]|uniref:Uncharacterized protein n=1 Tax=Sporisorium scitamineum TaxID=49012 RepID=A0A0F7RZT7_9BASI|nr:hypothetical protein [Sporisorium scitamineum]
MSRSHQDLFATVRDEVLTFPAFVHLPASARPQSQHLLTANKIESVKCIALSASVGPGSILFDRSTGIYRYASLPYKGQIAFRWGISEDIIRALAVNLDGKRILIEDMDDWGDWVTTYFFKPTLNLSTSDYQRRREFIIQPIHIDVIVDVPDEPDGQQTATTSTAANVSGLAPNAPPAYHPEEDRENIQAPQQPPSEAAQSASSEGASSRPTQSAAAESMISLVNNVVGIVLQTLQPQLQALPQSILSSLSASLASTNATAMPSASAVPTAFETTVPAPSQPPTAQQTSDPTQRQSLIDGLFDELSRLRAQPPSSSSADQPSPAAGDVGPTEGEMNNELSQAFAEMLARQRSAVSSINTGAGAAEVASGGATAAVADEDEESLTIVSTPSSSRRSSRSNSRSRGARRTLLSGTTLLVLTLITCIFGFIAPVSASPRVTALNPANPLSPRDAPTPLVEPHQFDAGTALLAKGSVESVSDVYAAVLS